ncbi:MAG: hypothetical protein LW854_17860 [Rubrivivax sp.]|nr:hypothetical protein [Rubrivivax sp.]
MGWRATHGAVRWLGLGSQRWLCAALVLAGLGLVDDSRGAPVAARADAQPRDGTAAPVEIRLEIDMGDEVAAGRFRPDQGDTLGLRGGWWPLQWQRSVTLVRREGSAWWELTLRVAQPPVGGQPIPHKLRIERAGQGPEAGWEEGANRLLPTATPSLTLRRRFNAPPELAPVQRTGDIENLGPVASAHVDARRVQVWLPPGYHTQPERRWPVLYLHDGQNVFDAQAAGSEWRFDETAQRLALAGVIAPPLIVAVDSTAQRVRDYTPTAQPAPSGTGAAGAPAATWGGGAPAYGRFLLDELKPLIDARYRTRPGVADTAVGGSSLGGLVSLWLALEYPQRVGAALVVSPSLWWDDQWALRRVQAGQVGGDAGGQAPAASSSPEATAGASITTPAPPGRPRLWLDIGLHEGPQALADTRALRAALQAQGWLGRLMTTAEDPVGTHSELAWAGRVEAMLLFLYGRRGVTPVVVD